MTKVFQCDRCKKLIANENVTNMMLVPMFSVQTNYDLCPECMNALKAFIKKAGEDNDKL